MSNGKKLNKEQEVDKLLSLGGIDPLLIETKSNLSEGGSDSWEYIAERCQRHDNVGTIANIIAAVTAASPYVLGEEWMTILMRPIKEYSFPEDPKLSPAYILGLVQGIFKACNWYDENSPLPAFDEQGLAKTLHFLINHLLAKNPITELADELLRDDKFAKTYESQLSQLIKAFARNKKINKGERLNTIVNLIRLAEEHRESGRLSEDKLSRLGTIILDQLNYAFFGSMSALAKTKAVLLLNKELLRAR